MATTLYAPTPTGGIKFSSGRKPGEVRIPNYVYDLWLPLLGTDAIAVYAVYCRLEREDVVKAITLDTLAKCCRVGKATLYKVNKKLEDCGFISVKSPTGNARAHHHTTEITVNDPPQEISQAMIEKYQSESGYEPLSKWLVADDTDVLPGTSRRSTWNDEDVLPGTSTVLQPSVLQPSRVVEIPPPLKVNHGTQQESLVQAWADLRGLNATGATVCTASRRRKAAEMLMWPIPATVEEIQAVTRLGMARKADYPFEFIPGDLIEYRATLAKQPKPRQRIVKLDEPTAPVEEIPLEERLRAADEMKVNFLKAAGG